MKFTLRSALVTIAIMAVLMAQCRMFLTIRRDLRLLQEATSEVVRSQNSMSWHFDWVVDSVDHIVDEKLVTRIDGQAALLAKLSELCMEIGKFVVRAQSGAVPEQAKDGGIVTSLQPETRQ